MENKKRNYFYDIFRFVMFIVMISAGVYALYTEPGSLAKALGAIYILLSFYPLLSIGRELKI